MIPVLFVEKNSIYKQLYCDPFDESRDARNYIGTSAIVAHPPCRLWSRMKAFSTAPEEEKELARFAVEVIKRNGGVLEHPAGSSLFKDPCIRGAGILFSVDQHWWGHPCQKKTILLINGITLREIPPVPLCFDTPTKVIDGSPTANRRGQYLPVSKRNQTPLEFAKWLIELAQVIESKKPPRPRLFIEEGAEGIQGTRRKRKLRYIITTVSKATFERMKKNL